MEISKLVRNEIDSFTDCRVMITDSYSFSQYDLVRKIYNLSNKIYPSGNIDSQGNYKYWFDVIGPRISDETKNIDIDTKDINLHSNMGNDRFRIFLANAVLREWMRETKQGAALNEDVEDSTGWGNVLWKKVRGGKVKLDFISTFVINQRARSVNETPVIEQHILSQSELRDRRGVYDTDAVDDLIESHPNESYISLSSDVVVDESIPFYEIFERNGEVCLADLNDAMEATGRKVNRRKGDDEKYVLAKVVLALHGKDGGGTILYAGRIKSMTDVYREYHRGRYNGRWFREGFYEQLADIQIRANEIGNQIARGMESAGKQLFTTDDPTAYKSVLTDLMNGDIIGVKNLQRVDTRFHEIENYMAEWNNLMKVADRITNAMEIVSGSDTPSAMPFRLGALLNQNANKTYLFVREKLGLAYKEMYEDWILPELLKSIRDTDVIRITGDKDYMDEYRNMVVDNWYAANLLYIGPHTKAEADLIRESKLRELSKSKDEFVSVERDYWSGFTARVEVDITGEAFDVNAEAQTIAQFLALETDPVRRQFLLDSVWTKYRIDTTKLPPVNLANEQLKAGTPAMGGNAPTPNQTKPQVL